MRFSASEVVTISIHALLAESDVRRLLESMRTAQFLSTLSLRRATTASTPRAKSARHFYPRSPCGERHRGQGKHGGNHHFYPRSPCGERHADDSKINKLVFAISIHALLAESDMHPWPAQSSRPIFLSTLSLRRATFSRQLTHHQSAFLSTLSLRRATDYG